jgi:hypothetical protein
VIRATKETEAGRRYLDLQRKAKRTGRPTDELIQLYALECFLDRLARSVRVDRFVLKGGVLLAALDARRPTRDIDLAAHGLENSAEHVLLLIREIAAIAIADGLIFDAEHATAETIRDDDHYSGVRCVAPGEEQMSTRQHRRCIYQHCHFIARHFSRHSSANNHLPLRGAVLLRRPEFRLKAGGLDDKTRWLLGDTAASSFEVLDASRAPLPVRPLVHAGRLPHSGRAVRDT